MRRNTLNKTTRQKCSQIKPPKIAKGLTFELPVQLRETERTDMEQRLGSRNFEVVLLCRVKVV